MAQFLQNGLGYGPLGAGLRLMPWGASTILVPALAGRLINHYGERPFIAGGMALHAAAFAWIALAARAGMPYWELVPALVLSGAGFAMASPATQSAVLTSIAVEHVGKASGALSMIRQLGGAFGVAMQVAVFAAAGSYTTQHTFIAGVRPALGACAALAFLGAIAGIALRARRPAAKRRAPIDELGLGPHRSRSEPRPGLRLTAKARDRHLPSDYTDARRAPARPADPDPRGV
jgi:MFS family permease